MIYTGVKKKRRINFFYAEIIKKGCQKDSKIFSYGFKETPSLNKFSNSH